MADEQVKDTSKEWVDGKPVRRLGDVLQGNIHRDFTMLADGYYTDGLLSRDERIALSGAIGDALQILTDRMPQEVADRPLDPTYWNGEEVPYAMRSYAVKELSSDATSYTVGGYGVVFGGMDLTGEHFTKETDFWFDRLTKTPMALYQHGKDGAVQKTVIGKATVKPDDIGVWVEAQLELSNKYVAAIRPLISQGKLGWSSGAVEHLVEYAGKTIKSWPIAEFSLTPTPAEPRCLGVRELRSIAEADPAVKAMLPEDVGDTSAQATKGDAEAVTITKQGDTKMPELTQEQIDAMIAKAVNDTVKAMATQPAAIKAAAVTVTMDEGDQPFMSLAEQVLAVRNYSVKGIKDVRLGRSRSDATKAVLGLNEGVDSEGAFAIQDDFAALLVQPMFAPGTLLGRMTPPIPLKGSSIKVPYIRDSAGAAGTRFGGMRTYKVAEGATITASAPAPLKRLNLELTKYACLYYATEELLEDAGALANQLQQFVPMSIRFDVENDIINSLVNPLGIMASPALVSVAKETGQAADTIVLENIVKMWSRMHADSRSNSIWLINQDVEPQLDLLSMSVGVGGLPVFLPAGGISGAGFDTLKGRPVVPVEYCQTLGDKGDIILCDLSQIVSAGKGGIKAASSIHLAFLTDQQCLRFTYRYTAQPGWETAYTPLNSTATLSPFVTLDARA